MSEILSQEEIDALKDAVSQGEVETLEDDEARLPRADTYDFVSRNQQLVSRLPGLKVIYSGFAGYLNTALAVLVRGVAKAELTSVHQVTADELIRSSESLSCLCSVRYPVAKQPILIVMDSFLLLSFIDAICGGEGRPINIEEKEEMSPIEQRLVRRLVGEAVKALEQAWQVISPARMELHSIEYRPQVITSVSAQEIVEVAVFQISMEEAQGELTLALPHGLIESVRTDLMMDQQEAETQENGQWALTLERSLVQVKVALAVEIARGRLNVRDFFNLKVGDVVHLDPHPEDKLVVSVESVPKFFGMAGTVRNTQAVQITSRID